MTEREAELYAECQRLRQDRDDWKKRCFTARKRRDAWEEKARLYADALLKLTGGPADEKVGRAWLADLGISGGDG